MPKTLYIGPFLLTTFVRQLTNMGHSLSGVERYLRHRGIVAEPPLSPGWHLREMARDRVAVESPTSFNFVEDFRFWIREVEADPSLLRASQEGTFEMATPPGTRARALAWLVAERKQGQAEGTVKSVAEYKAALKLKFSDLSGRDVDATWRESKSVPGVEKIGSGPKRKTRSPGAEKSARTQNK